MFLPKRILSLLAILLCLSLFFMNAAASETPRLTPGDLNQDGQATAADALLILQQSVGLRESPLLEPLSDFLADMNGDGSIDASDALLVLQASVGLTTAAFTEIAFSSETLSLTAGVNIDTPMPEYTVSFEAWKQRVNSLQKSRLLTEEQAADLLARYDGAFFKEHALIFGIDSIPSTASVTASQALCSEQQFLVILNDGSTPQEEACPHLVLISLSQQELRNTGCFSKLDKASVLFERAGTIPRPNDSVSNAFYGPSDAFDYAALYEIGSHGELLAYAGHARSMIADEQQGDLGLFQEYQNMLLPRSSEQYFKEYRTLIFEEHDYTRSSTRYEYRGMEDNGDGTQTLLLEKIDYAPLPVPDNQEDVLFDNFLTVRMTLIDLPADPNAAPITRVCGADRTILWEKPAE